MRQKKLKPKTWEDHYSRQAKKERYPARSVYKLKEIQRKYNLIKKGDAVLDLGCHPGSWLLFAASVVGDGGRVAGVDLTPVTVALPRCVRVRTGDVGTVDESLLNWIGKGYNVVLSDLAPSTIGNPIVDAARSFDLCKNALYIAENVLKPGGSFVCKIFHGEDFNVFYDLIKIGFNQHRIFKPQSSRKKSREIYVIGLGKK